MVVVGGVGSGHQWEWLLGSGGWWVAVVVVIVLVAVVVVGL